MTYNLLRAIGVFYAFGGVLVLIRIEQARSLDKLYAALTGGPQLRHFVRTLLLTLGGILTCVGGVALAGLSARTMPLMGVNTLVQLGWLAFATAYFPAEDDEDRKGRSRTASAAVVYAIAFGMLLWMTRNERAVLTNSRTMDVMIALLLGVLGAWQVWSSWRHRATSNSRSQLTSPPSRGLSAPREFVRPTRVELRPFPGAWPLWDCERGDNVDPAKLELPGELIERLQRFENAVLESLEQDTKARLVFRDARRKRELEQQATALATELERHLGHGAVAWRMPDDVE